MYHFFILKIPFLFIQKSVDVVEFLICHDISLKENNNYIKVKIWDMKLELLFCQCKHL